ncbi:hypothetical protein EYF80_031141 [Liparis tanakae]|uniref:Uncharacterized protein n=1 Tax=Liparis tanakae TaxID=230148 RepID=A0A4Z2GYF3_9TELE|nr:hypothetical protein EYF80_031141 [Liparis tanakae]
MDKYLKPSRHLEYDHLYLYTHNRVRTSGPGMMMMGGISCPGSVEAVWGSGVGEDARASEGFTVGSAAVWPSSDWSLAFGASWAAAVGSEDWVSWVFSVWRSVSACLLSVSFSSPLLLSTCSGPPSTSIPSDTGLVSSTLSPPLSSTALTSSSPTLFSSLPSSINSTISISSSFNASFFPSAPLLSFPVPFLSPFTSPSSISSSSSSSISSFPLLPITLTT